MVRNILREMINRTNGDKMYITGEDNNYSSSAGSKANDIHFMNSSNCSAGESNNHHQEIPVDPVLCKDKQVPPAL